jgi:membrane associated rhomboid family serine protease
MSRTLGRSPLTIAASGRSPTSEACLLGSYCGLSPTDTPNQTYRFFVPIVRLRYHRVYPVQTTLTGAHLARHRQFLHAGVVHLLLNGVVLYVVGGQIEREIGSLSFAVIFFAGAVFGFLFGANFALPAVPSVGASGGIFAINAVAVVDLGLHWKLEARPKLKLVFLIFEFALMVGMGFIPYLIDVSAPFFFPSSLVAGLTLVLRARPRTLPTSAASSAASCSVSSSSTYAPSSRNRSC